MKEPNWGNQRFGDESERVAGVRIERRGQGRLGKINLSPFPVPFSGLINLTQTGALLVIDNDGYSNALVALANPDDVTVPAKAGIRQTFVFEGGAEGIKAVRLWGKDLPVK